MKLTRPEGLRPFPPAANPPDSDSPLHAHDHSPELPILDQREDSPAYAQFKDLAQAANKLENFHGSRRQGFKKDGVNVHFEQVARRVLVVSAVHLYAKKESRFTPYAGDVAPGVILAANRSGLVATHPWHALLIGRRWLRGPVRPRKPRLGTLGLR